MRGRRRLITGGGKQERRDGSGDGEDDDRLEGGGGMELTGGHGRSAPTSDLYGGFPCSNGVSLGTLQSSSVCINS